MLAVYLDDLGICARDIAILMSVFAVTGLGITQVYGYLADTMFRRNTLVFWMTVWVMFSYAIFPFFPPNIGWLSLGMAMIALGHGPRIMLIAALTLESWQGEERYGRIRLLGSLGFAIVAPIVGLLVDSPSLTPAVMFPSAIAVELAFLLCLPFLHDLPPRERHGVTHKKLSFKKAQKKLLSNSLMVKFLLFMFLYQTIGGQPHIMQMKLIQVIGLSAFFGAACMSFAAIAEMTIFFYGNNILSRVRLMPLMALLPLVVAIRWGIIFFFPTAVGIFLSNGLHLITYGLAYMCGVIFIHREAPMELRSSAQTLYGLVYGLVAGLSGNLVMIGILWILGSCFSMNDFDALTMMYGILAVLVLFSFVAWFPMKREYVRKHRVSGIWIPRKKIGD